MWYMVYTLDIKFIIQKQKNKSYTITETIICKWVGCNNRTMMRKWVFSNGRNDDVKKTMATRPGT